MHCMLGQLYSQWLCLITVRYAGEQSLCCIGRLLLSFLVACPRGNNAVVSLMLTTMLG